MSDRKRYVVIFRATIRSLDQEYMATAKRMRELAQTQFGCVDFQSLTEGDKEVTLSFWPDEESIQKWRMHPEHVRAQQLGQQRWYTDYHVQVAELRRDYHSNR